MTVLNLHMNLLPVHKKTWSVSCPRTAHPCQSIGAPPLSPGLKMWPSLPSASSHPQFYPSISFLEGALCILQWTIVPLFILSPLQLGPDPCPVTEMAIFYQTSSLSSFIVFQQNQGQLTSFSGTLPIPNLCLRRWYIPRT